MAKTRENPAQEEESAPSETSTTDFSFITVNVGGKSHEVAFPSDASRAAGVVSCSEGHPCTPDPSTGEINCGCGSTEVAAQ